jgi:hypothetical protein
MIFEAHVVEYIEHEKFLSSALSHLSTADIILVLIKITQPYNDKLLAQTV